MNKNDSITSTNGNGANNNSEWAAISKVEPCSNANPWLILENSPVCIIVFDHHGQVIYANSYSKQVLGVDKQLVQQRQYNSKHWKIRDCNGEALSDELSPFNLVFTHAYSLNSKCYQVQWPDGRKILVSMNATRLYQRCGSLQYIIFTLAEVRGDEQADLARQQSEERYRTLVENLQEGIWGIDKYGRTTFVNPKMANMLGYSNSQMLGKDLFQFIPDSERFIAKYYLRQRKRNMKESCDIGFLNKNGEMVYTQIKATAIFDENNQYTGALAAVTDITARKRAEQLLLEGSKRYQSLVASLSEGIVIQTADGRVVSCNTSAEQILGLNHDQLMGITPVTKTWHVIHKDGRRFREEEHPALITLRTGQPCRNVTMGIEKLDGSVTWISMNAQPLFQPESENPYKVVTSFSDITELIQLEQKLTQQASTDYLTNVANRRHFLVLAEQEFNHSQRFSKPLSLLLLDIDHFKDINDHFGHQAGDAVLKHLVTYCEKLLRRKIDLLARYGGEEFVILLPDTDEAKAQQVAEQLRRCIAEQALLRNADTIRYQISVGVACSHGDNNLDALIARADKALYQAKRNGRNCVCSYSEYLQIAPSPEHEMLT